jgi:pSer/pThr/pTyr-binding forkhead associated (FHA) protein
VNRITVRGTDGVERSYTLHGGNLVIGRDPGSGICLDDAQVSWQHAMLSDESGACIIEDLGSSNGTFVGPASGPLPERPIAVGPKTELDDDDRLYVGAWTRVVVRRATSDEVEAYA